MTAQAFENVNIYALLFKMRHLKPVATRHQLQGSIVSTLISMLPTQPFGLQIFAEEVLGYSNVSIVRMSDPTHAFDPDHQFSYISSCSDLRWVNFYLQFLRTLVRILVIKIPENTL